MKTSEIKKAKQMWNLLHILQEQFVYCNGQEYSFLKCGPGSPTLAFPPSPDRGRNADFLAPPGPLNQTKFSRWQATL